jgi:hypothetical protein
MARYSSLSSIDSPYTAYLVETHLSGGKKAAWISALSLMEEVACPPEMALCFISSSCVLLWDVSPQLEISCPRPC